MPRVKVCIASDSRPAKDGSPLLNFDHIVRVFNNIYEDVDCHDERIMRLVGEWLDKSIVYVVFRFTDHCDEFVAYGNEFRARASYKKCIRTLVEEYNETNGIDADGNEISLTISYGDTPTGTFVGKDGSFR